MIDKRTESHKVRQPDSHLDSQSEDHTIRQLDKQSVSQTVTEAGSD